TAEIGRLSSRLTLATSSAPPRSCALRHDDIAIACRESSPLERRLLLRKPRISGSVVAVNRGSILFARTVDGKRQSQVGKCCKERGGRNLDLGAEHARICAGTPRQRNPLVCWKPVWRMINVCRSESTAPASNSLQSDDD